MAAKDDALKRLGGGRWQTRDGRFTIEPQSGSWVVVDAEQTDDLGLPRVRGPFGSLTAARDVIGAARTEAAPVSPLAERVEAAADRPVRERRAPQTARRPALARPGRRAEPDPPPAPEPPSPPAPPPPPPEPAWIATLPVRARPAARRRVAELEAAGRTDAADLVRAERIDGEPAIVRAALRQRIAEAVAAGGSAEAIAASIADLLAGGEDASLGVQWRLVDGEGRAIGPLDGEP